MSNPITIEGYEIRLDPQPGRPCAVVDDDDRIVWCAPWFYEKLLGLAKILLKKKNGVAAIDVEQYRLPDEIQDWRDGISSRYRCPFCEDREKIYRDPDWFRNHLITKHSKHLLQNSGVAL